VPALLILPVSIVLERRQPIAGQDRVATSRRTWATPPFIRLIPSIPFLSPRALRKRVRDRCIDRRARALTDITQKCLPVGVSDNIASWRGWEREPALISFVRRAPEW